MTTRAFITISGTAYPLTQVTLRRSRTEASLSFQVVGQRLFAIGAAVLLSVEGFTDISATLTDSTPGEKSTTGSADLAIVSGTGEFDPAQILYRSNGVTRTPIDFDVLPGDTWLGIEILSTTSTLGAASPAFTEIRF